jgi:hypothetical protein
VHAGCRRMRLDDEHRDVRHERAVGDRQHVPNG